MPRIEGEREIFEQNFLSFGGTEAFKTTYLTSCTTEMFSSAYGKLVDLGSTHWLKELSVRSKKPNLRHLMICFDDGPCHEIVCRDFAHTTA